MFVCCFTLGTSHQPSVLTTEKEHQFRQSGQHPAPIQQPNNDDSPDTDRMDEESAGSSKGDQRPECLPFASSGHRHGKGVWSKRSDVINTISSSEMPAEGRGKPTDREQRPERTPPTSTNVDREKADHVPETPIDESSASQKCDQRLRCSSSNSSQQGHEEATGLRGETVTNATKEATDKLKGLPVADVTPSGTSSSQGQDELIKGEGLCEDMAPSETTVSTSSTTDLTADGKPAETVRGLAVLERTRRNEISHSSELQDTYNAGPGTELEKSYDHQTVSDDQNQKTGKGKDDDKDPAHVSIIFQIEVFAFSDT